MMREMSASERAARDTLYIHMTGEKKRAPGGTRLFMYSQHEPQASVPALARIDTGR
jgi:hypothetical protein